MQGTSELRTVSFLRKL